MELISIAAIGKNNVIGKDNKLLWHLSDDFKRFKKLTSGKYIIMGRKTFESFPKPLPNRTHIIVTRQKDYKVPDGHIVVNNLKDAIACVPFDEEKAYVIGGGEIYKESMDLVDVLEITHVNESYKGDTFFPEINESIWNVLEEEYHPKDKSHNIDFTYKTWKRI